MYNTLDVTVRKWGNSLGIRIPKQIAGLMHVDEGTKLKMTFRKDHVELRISGEELTIRTPVRNAASPDHLRQAPSRSHHPPSPDLPDYSSRPRGRRTPMKLTDDTFGEGVARYPFVVVLFLDYMYMDFYEHIEERLAQLREMAETYAGYVWFASADMQKNEQARERYVGNIWGEEEVRGFINGEMAFKTERLLDVEDIIRRILPGEVLDSIGKRKTRSVPVIASIENFNSILSGNEYVVAGFFPPGEKGGVAVFNDLAREYADRVTFALTTDRVLFNEKNRTFYRNPLFERFNIVEEREVIFFNRGNLLKRTSLDDGDSIKDTIDLYLSGRSGT